MTIQQCYISNGRLKDAPQVRMKTITEPFLTLESAIEWANKVLFSFTIREWNGMISSPSDKILYESDTVKSTVPYLPLIY